MVFRRQREVNLICDTTHAKSIGTVVVGDHAVAVAAEPQVPSVPRAVHRTAPVEARAYVERRRTSHSAVVVIVPTTYGAPGDDAPIISVVVYVVRKNHGVLR